MPIYEYECRECGTHFQKLQRFGDAPLETCPLGHADVHRLLSRPAIIFKGSGFYVTDNRRNGSTVTSGKSAKSESENKSETKSENKSESKSESKSGSEKKTDTKKS